MSGMHTWKVTGVIETSGEELCEKSADSHGMVKAVGTHSKMSMEENKIYLDYMLRRLSAIPCIWWSMANEYDLLFNRKIEDWYEFEKIISENDVYGHLLSNHNCTKLYDFSKSAITHCCVQSIAMHRAGQWQQEFEKPVVYDECCYEGDIQYEWGNISGC